MKKSFLTWASMAAVLTLTGCATHQSYDYTAFKQSRPKSILVLPPVNESPEIKATPGMLAAATVPLAESGYYVFPVAVVNETFKQNGLTIPAEIHQVGLDKLNKIFAPDAVLYITVKKYGTSYKIITSETVVRATAKLVDAKTGKELWSGTAQASSEENKSNNQGLLSMLVTAVINQVVDTVQDRGFSIARITGYRLLGAGRPNGMLYGPYSPLYRSEDNIK